MLKLTQRRSEEFSQQQSRKDLAENFDQAHLENKAMLLAVLLEEGDKELEGKNASGRWNINFHSLSADHVMSLVMTLMDNDPIVKFLVIRELLHSMTSEKLNDNIKKGG